MMEDESIRSYIGIISEIVARIKSCNGIKMRMRSYGIS